MLEAPTGTSGAPVRRMSRSMTTIQNPDGGPTLLRESGQPSQPFVRSVRRSQTRPES
ncbi:unnamed protein product, partial [Amoebophrya sp. A120]|eukprot:GSA120T00023315001.1